MKELENFCKFCCIAFLVIACIYSLITWYTTSNDMRLLIAAVCITALYLK